MLALCQAPPPLPYWASQYEAASVAMETSFRRKRARKSFGLSLDPLKKRLSERGGWEEGGRKRRETEGKKTPAKERKTEGLDRRERQIR